MGRLLAAASAAAVTLGDAPAAAAPAAGGVRRGEGEEEAAAPAAAAAAAALRAHACQSLRLAWCAALQECRKGAAPALAGAAAGYTPDFLASALPEALLLGGAAGDGGRPLARVLRRGRGPGAARRAHPRGGPPEQRPWPRPPCSWRRSKGGASAYVSLAQVSTRTRAPAGLLTVLPRKDPPPLSRHARPSRPALGPRRSGPEGGRAGEGVPGARRADGAHGPRAARPLLRGPLGVPGRGAQGCVLSARVRAAPPAAGSGAAGQGHSRPRTPR